MHTPSRSCFCRLARLSALTGGLLALGVASVHAQTYNVSLDTAGLNLNDSYAVDLQLNQGGTTPNSTTPNSTVNVGSFLFGGSSAGPIGTAQYSGLASGSLSSAVALGPSAASPFNEFMQNFNNGSSLGFTVNAAQLAAATGGAPDQFFFDLYDNTTGAPVATDDNVTGGNFALFTLTRDSAGVYAPNAFSYTGADGYARMTRFSTPSATPELGTVTSLGLLMGLFGLGVLRARRGQAQNAAGAE